MAFVSYPSSLLHPGVVAAIVDGEMHGTRTPRPHFPIIVVSSDQYQISSEANLKTSQAAVPCSRSNAGHMEPHLRSSMKPIRMADGWNPPALFPVGLVCRDGAVTRRVFRLRQRPTIRAHCGTGFSLQTRYDSSIQFPAHPSHALQ